MHSCRPEGLRTLTLLQLLTVLLLVSACAGPEVKKAPRQERQMPVYVVSHGWHTGIVIAGRNLSSELAFLDSYFDSANWYEFGWGDRKYYQAEEATAGLTLRAGLWPTAAVLHVTALPETPDTYFSRSRTIRLQMTETAHNQMSGAIAQYFMRNEQNKVIMTGEGLYGESLFFNAKGRFHVFNTCNTWVAKMLRKADMPIRVFATVTADSLMSQVSDAASENQDMERVDDSQ